ncbi:hypothetical protein [Terribacillus sp. 7520-G]|uniref:hypothetical protein n=1 Tax=Terribacillus TaxID=459532 RepID=UPI000BA4FAE4|nr:hypothetical protein [Terribacillus sp. 7520-G]PAD38617.1 hypothetical protein CHH53_10325 [Terribacillus sp. 7520-G]
MKKFMVLVAAVLVFSSLSPFFATKSSAASNDSSEKVDVNSDVSTVEEPGNFLADEDIEIIYSGSEENPDISEFVELDTQPVGPVIKDSGGFQTRSVQIIEGGGGLNWRKQKEYLGSTKNLNALKNLVMDGAFNTAVYFAAGPAGNILLNTLGRPVVNRLKAKKVTYTKQQYWYATDKKYKYGKILVIFYSDKARKKQIGKNSTIARALK